MESVFVEDLPVAGVEEVEEEGKGPVGDDRGGEGEVVVGDAVDEEGAFCGIPGDVGGVETERRQS